MFIAPNVFTILIAVMVLIAYYFKGGMSWSALVNFRLEKATKKRSVPHVQSMEESDDEGRDETEEERGACH